MERLERIKHYEAIFDEVSAKVEKLNLALDEFEAIMPMLEELETYYASKTYRDDYDADEAGLIPKDLKRGILSEDGIYNLLADSDKYRNLIK